MLGWQQLRCRFRCDLTHEKIKCASITNLILIVENYSGRELRPDL